MMKNRPSDVTGSGQVLDVVGGRIREWDDVDGSVRLSSGQPVNNGVVVGSVDHNPGVIAVDPDDDRIVRVKGHLTARPELVPGLQSARASDEIGCNGVVSSGTNGTTLSGINGTVRVARSASLEEDLAEVVPTAGDVMSRGDADGACDPADVVSTRRSSMPDTRAGLPDAALVVPASSYSLSAVLETIPLAYDPQTRQLRLISLNRHQDVSDGELVVGDCRKISGSSDNDEPVATDTDCAGHRTTESEGVPDVVVRLRSETRSESSSTDCRRQPDCGDAFLGLQRVSTNGSLHSRAECCSSVSSISSLSTDVSFSVFNDDGAVGGHEAALTAGGGSARGGHHSYVLLDSDEAGFIEINLDQRQHGRTDQLQPPQPPPPAGSPDSATGLQSADEEGGCSGSGDQGGAKAKRRGLSGLLNRSLLPWKSTRTPNLAEDADAPGWKLFGKTPPRHTACRDPNKIIEEYHPADGIVDHQSNSSHSADSNQARQRQLSSSEQTAGSNNTTPKSKKGNGLVASSTTALILENRPLNLPAKDPDEELKHRLEYEQMVEFAKKREIKEAKLKKKQMQQQLKHEEQLFLASKIWNSEILPNWETTKVSRKTRELWWQGIPPSVRGKVWKLAIGNDLHITPELYEICVCRAKDRIRMAAEMISVSEEDCFEEGLADKEGSVELIKLDVSRSFPQLCIFQKGGPYYDMLHSLLGAYVCYRPDVGYVQGMSFLAAVLILNLEVADAFICFANLLNQPCQLAFFRLDEPMMRSYFSTYEDFFRENMPKLFGHFGKQNLSADLYLIDWIYTLYSRSLPLDVASRVWDVFFRDGDEFLFRTALGILRLYEDILSQLDFIHLAQFLTKLPEDISPEPLFKSIESVKMICDKHTFAQVLLNHTETRQT